MVTTAVVAEIVVGGLEAEAWISLLVLAIFGSNWVHLREIRDWVALVTLLILAAAYVLGVLIDRLADTLVVRLLEKVPGSRPVDKPANIERMRMRLLVNDNAAANFLDYQRSRMRVARATVLNLLMLLPVVVVFLLRQTSANPPEVVAAAIVTCAALIVTAQVYRGIEFAYLCRLSETYRLAESLPEADIAAAVCYRERNAELEFAIIRTRDERFWTFPKGHRNGGETLPEAARREAHEEAGIEGAVDGKRLFTFRYPPSRRGRHDDDWVAAFLLKTREVGPSEESRELKWCTFDEARVLLATDRDHKYAEEMEGALLAATREAELKGGPTA